MLAIKRNYFLVLLVLSLFSCSKDSEPAPKKYLVKYEIIFSTTTAQKPANTGENQRFRITKLVDDTGISQYSYPAAGLSKWDTSFTINSNKTPLDIGFETTVCWLANKGQTISNIYLNNVTVKTKLDTSRTYGVNHGVPIGPFYHTIK